MEVIKQQCQEDKGIIKNIINWYDRELLGAVLDGGRVGVVSKEVTFELDTKSQRRVCSLVQKQRESCYSFQPVQSLGDFESEQEGPRWLQPNRGGWGEKWPDHGGPGGGTRLTLLHKLI